MIERIGQRPISRTEAKDLGMADPCVSAFEARLANVKPFDLGRRRAINLGDNTTVINPDRFLPAVLWIHNEGADILLGDGSELRYDMGMHYDIARQNDVGWNPMDLLLKSTLMTVGDKRFLSVEILPNLTNKNLGKIKEILDKYKLQGVFAPKYDFDHDEALGTGIAGKDGTGKITWLSQNEFTTAMDDLVKDDWTSQVAERYILTNTELLRMRLTGQLPEEKQKPIRK